MGVQDPEQLISLLGLKTKRVVIIPNAWDAYSAERKAQEVAGCQRIFQSLGFKRSVIDLAKTSSDNIKVRLAKTDPVWVTGGNMFYLNYQVQASGFADALKSLADSDLVYGGESAGAVVAGSTLHGIENLDEKDTVTEVIWNGLGLIKTGIIPHWGWDKYVPLLEACRLEMEKYDAVTTLTNEQVLVFTNEKMTIT